MNPTFFFYVQSQHNSINEEQCDKLENQLKEDKFTMAESERKYEDIARKLATMENEQERSDERCTMGEKKIIDLEEELKVKDLKLTLELFSNSIIGRWWGKICNNLRFPKKRLCNERKTIKIKYL